MQREKERREHDAELALDSCLMVSACADRAKCQSIDRILCVVGRRCCKYEIRCIEQAAGVKPDVFSYSSLMTACASGGKTEEALDVFKSMQATGVEPDVISYNSLITACANGGKFRQGLEVFECASEAGLACGNYEMHHTLLEACQMAGDVLGAQRMEQLIEENQLSNLAPSASASIAAFRSRVSDGLRFRNAG